MSHTATTMVYPYLGKDQHVFVIYWDTMFLAYSSTYMLDILLGTVRKKASQLVVASWGPYVDVCGAGYKTNGGCLYITNSTSN